MTPSPASATAAIPGSHLSMVAEISAMGWEVLIIVTGPFARLPLDTAV